MAENENVTVESAEVEATEVENTAVVEEQQTAPTERTKESFGAKVKEWFRKQLVTLKRKPQRIPFLFFIISTVMYLIGLNVMSPGPVSDFGSQKYLGLSVFITTLFSILVLVLFMNTFPKRGIRYKKNGKKHNMNYIMLALTFVFVIVMFLFDLLYYKQMLGCIANNEPKFFRTMAEANQYKKYWRANFSAAEMEAILDATSYKDYLLKSLRLDIAHMVFLGISAVLLATLPLYRKLIMKINTSKVIESTEIKETIDVED